jgi:uncharacterized protein YjbI with pentapeptide repeats
MTWLAVLLAGAFIAFLVLAYRMGWEWTGFPEGRSDGGDDAIQPAKTLWDWLQLLVVPLALAGLAFFLNNAQSDRAQRQESKHAEQQRAVSLDTRREATLRDYLKQISDLVLDRGLLHSKPEADVREIARTATLTAVRRLDGERKGVAVRFLAEARLLKVKTRLPPWARVPPPRPIVEIYGADLSSTILAHAFLRNVDLAGADLRQANFAAAYLSGAVLASTDLRGADLRHASLGINERDWGADLGNANLVGADLRGADLFGAHLTQANLRGQDLRGTNLEADLQLANLDRAHLERTRLSGADLLDAHLSEAHLIGVRMQHAHMSGADLRGADLRGANLGDADLTKANLLGANLTGAHVDGADLRDAKGVDLTGTKGAPAYAPTRRCPRLRTGPPASRPGTGRPPPVVAPTSRRGTTASPITTQPSVPCSG